MPMGLPGHSGAHLGRLARRKVVKSCPLGPKVAQKGPQRSQKGPKRSPFGDLWGPLGSFLDVFGRFFAPSRRHLGQKSVQSVNSLNPTIS